MGDARVLCRAHARMHARSPRLPHAHALLTHTHTHTAHTHTHAHTQQVGDFLYVQPEVFDQLPAAVSEVERPDYAKVHNQ